MEENAKSQNGRENAMDFTFKIIQTKCVIIICNGYVAGKYIVVHKECILLFRLIICILYSFTCVFSPFYIGLLFTRTCESFI